MNVKKYIPKAEEAIKINIVFVVLAVTGISMFRVAKAKKLTEVA
jgi:hypothetical protein